MFIFFQTLNIIKLYCYPFYNYLKNTINFNKETLIYFDLETTGLNPYSDKIIEYCFLSENKNEYISSLVNPLIKFDKKITNITGIYPDELKNKESINCHIPKIFNFINKRNTFMVAHNCDSFDKLFITESFKKYNKQQNKLNYSYIKFIDTLSLSKKILPKNKNYSLKHLAEYFNITCGNHRALSDTECLRNLYYKLLEIYSKENNKDLDTLINNPSIVYNLIY